MATIPSSIDKYEDVIYSRDLNARIEWLESNDDKDDDEKAELAALVALKAEAEGYSSDWQYGATLIRDSYFRDYAQELAEDIGAIDHNAQWPNACIDWDQAARELQMDYSAIEFDGITYWVR
jgi:exoribonuclease II